MEKAGVKKRDIKFFSKRNGGIVIVHSDFGKRYADALESDNEVKNYKCNVELDQTKYIHVQAIGIRKSYFSTIWTTDFLIEYIDGKTAVREIVVPSTLLSKAILEKLEFSRRYWEQQGINDWKVVLLEA